MRKVKEEAYSSFGHLYKQIQKRYDWQGIFPTSVQNLIVFKAIYKEAGLEFAPIDEAISMAIARARRVGLEDGEREGEKNSHGKRDNLDMLAGAFSISREEVKILFQNYATMPIRKSIPLWRGLSRYV